MDRLTRLLTLAGCLALMNGCAITGPITGTWRTVSVDPPGAPFPLDAITFDHNKNYTASWARAGKTRTTLGQYRWNGSRLDVVRSGNQPQTYKASVGLDGRLTMTYGSGDSKIQARLERENVKTSKRQNVETSKRRNVETSKRRNVETSKRQDRRLTTEN